MREADPYISAADMAGKIGVSRERVRQVLIGLGMRTDTYTRRLPANLGVPPAQFAKRSTLSIGAASELIVCVDLLGRGLDVFRSVSQNAKCDVIALDRATGSISRIEVKTARASLEGKPQFPKPNGHCVHDHVAAVLPDGSIVYDPPLAETP
jgi:hypothetical protein